MGHVQAVRATGTTASWRTRSVGRAGRRTWAGRRRTDTRSLAMERLGNGLSDAKHYEEASSVREVVCLRGGALAITKKTMLV